MHKSRKIQKKKGNSFLTTLLDVKLIVIVFSLHKLNGCDMGEKLPRRVAPGNGGKNPKNAEYIIRVNLASVFEKEGHFEWIEKKMPLGFN